MFATSTCVLLPQQQEDGRTDRHQKTENRKQKHWGGGYKCTYTVAVQKVAQKLAS